MQMLSTHCTLWCWAHCFSPCRGERIQNVQYAKICPALPSLPSTDSWAAPGDHAGTCSRKLYSRIPGLQSCPSRAQSHSRPIYYCRSNAKELFHLLAILGEQEVTKRPAENAKGSFLLPIIFLFLSNPPFLVCSGWKQQGPNSNTAGPLWSCSAFPGICQQGH